MRYVGLIAIAMQGGGRMTVDEIYRRVRREAKRWGVKLSPCWKATVRNTLQRHCRRNGKGRPPYVFIHHDRALWEFRR